MLTSGGSRISEKGGPAFFYFCFSTGKVGGGGDNFAKKNPNKKQTIGVLLTVQVFIKTYP